MLNQQNNDPDTPPGHAPNPIDEIITLLLGCIKTAGDQEQNAFTRATRGDIQGYGNHCAKRANLYQALCLLKSARSPSVHRKNLLALDECEGSIPNQFGGGKSSME